MSHIKRFYWKGKKVSEAVYMQRIIQSNCGSNIAINRKVCKQERKVENDAKKQKLEESVEEAANPGEGRRIVELLFLGQQMWCTSCKECLSFAHIEAEQRRGLGSILSIRCHTCLWMNVVETGTRHSAKNVMRSNLFDVNSKMALGMMHSGIGFSNSNKLLACMNIPTVDFRTFKRYEIEIGSSMEIIAKESCEESAALERKLTLENASRVQENLPQSMQNCFYNPETSKPVDGSSDPVSFNSVVQIMASYDMGWSTRGTGRNYDSLNGFGAIICALSGKIIDYATCNRKCKKCIMGRSPFDHDCRLNFWGSAKAMEAHVANKLVNESSILKSQNVQVGILVGDDDSSSIAACRANASHQIGKLSDTNHTSKGVKSQLYGIEKSHKELSRDGIIYLHRCFTYAMAQNKGNSVAMAETIRSIPYHAFNIHDKYSLWCGFVQDPKNYEHKMIPGGFKDQKLFTALIDVFEKLASNAEKFSVGVSSNANESLNASMASKAPKSKCLSLSASSDFRFSCVVSQKNLGENYTSKCVKSLKFSPGKHHFKHVSRNSFIKQKRAIRIAQKEYKERRMQVKKYRAALRHQREATEGTTYKSDCALVNEPAIQLVNNDPMSEDEGTVGENIPIVYLDLETSGLHRDCDILQIAAKCGRFQFDKYVTPTKEISASATAVHGLRKCEAELMLHGKKVVSVPLRIAIGELQEFLCSINEKCYIATHNLSFDGPRLLDAITSCSLHEEFSKIIEGFIDTLAVIRNKTSRRGKGLCTLSGLATWLNISNFHAHNACDDVAILEKIMRKAEITYKILSSSAKDYSELKRKWNFDKHILSTLPSLQALKEVTSLEIRKKLIRADITIENLREAFDDSGSLGIYALLSNKVNGKSVVTANKKCIQKIVDWFAKI